MNSQCLLILKLESLWAAVIGRFELFAYPVRMTFGAEQENHPSTPAAGPWTPLAALKGGPSDEPFAKPSALQGATALW